MQLSATQLHDLYDGEFADYRKQEPVAEWRRRYLEHVRAVRAADRDVWISPEFQELLWDSDAVSSIGPGQSVTVTKAYSDEALARMLFSQRDAIFELDLEARSKALEALYQRVLAHVYPQYTPRRPRARIVRLLAAIFPQDMTCLMDKKRVWAIQRAIGAQRMAGEFVAQHPAIRAAIVQVVGVPKTEDDAVDQSIFSWFLWEAKIDKPDEGAVAIEALQRKASAVPPFSLLPAAAQRRSLAWVKDNVALLQAITREAEQGISRDDLVSVIISEATQLNPSSAGNIISQAMGGLGLLRLEDGAYRPTERGLELLTADEPAQALRGPLVGRVFGMGHLLLMIGREPGTIGTAEAAKRLQRLVPTWRTTQPGSHIATWARMAGLIVADPRTGVLSLSEEGEDYAAALPDYFEDRWRIEGPVPSDVASAEVEAETAAGDVALEPYTTASIVADGCFLDAADLDALLALLKRRQNLILQGPPGTGKTWLAKRLGYALIGDRDAERLVAVQFQPTLSYEDFIRGWRPDGKGSLQLADGVFLDAIAAALADPTRAFVVVIEEINRGNPAQILGEFLTLIENSKREPSESLRLAYPRTVDERVYVPPNLFIIGTMNVADRSLALVDLALRRRFAFVDLRPQLGAPWRRWCIAKAAPTAIVDAIANRVEVLNARIAGHRSLGQHFCIGHSFVTPAISPGSSAEDWISWFLSAVDYEIGPLLREYWYDDIGVAEEEIALLRQPF